jgi:hypothetical protein
MRLIATIEKPAVVCKILAHLGLATEVPDALPARSPYSGFSVALAHARRFSTSRRELAPSAENRSIRCGSAAAGGGTDKNVYDDAPRGAYSPSTLMSRGREEMAGVVAAGTATAAGTPRGALTRPQPQR